MIIVVIKITFQRNQPSLAHVIEAKTITTVLKMIPQTTTSRVDLRLSLRSVRSAAALLVQTKRSRANEKTGG